MQATRQAVEVMLAAVAATGETAKRVDATLAELQQLQVSVAFTADKAADGWHSADNCSWTSGVSAVQEQQAARLAQLRKVKGEPYRELPRKALPADLRTGTAALEDLVGDTSKVGRVGLCLSAAACNQGFARFASCFCADVQVSSIACPFANLLS